MDPYPYQVQSITHLLHCLSGNRAAVDASDMGTGKTLVAIEVEKALNLPTLVVGPKALRATWERTAGEQHAELDFINYEMLRTGRTPYGDWQVPPHCRKPRFYFNPGVRFVIFDEAHRCMGQTSLNSDLMRACRRQNILALALSATFADSPLELDALGYLLHLHDSNDPPSLRNPDPDDFGRWAMRHGCGRNLFSRGSLMWYGSIAEKKKQMAKIGRLIFPNKGVRVTIKELGARFPSTQILAELYDMGNAVAIQRLYDRMERALKQLHLRTENYSNDSLSDLMAEMQEVEILKVPTLVDLTQDALASGFSVVIFVNYRLTLTELSTLLDCQCVIHGDQTDLERERCRLAFQNNDSRLILAIGSCGGVGLDLHDLDGDFPRYVLNCAGFDAKLERQKLGRVRRAGGKSKSIQRFVFAAHTCEEDIYRVCSRKMDRLDALQDGDLMPDNLRNMLTR